MKYATNQKLYFERCFNLPSPGLRAYFKSVVSGQPDEYRTTFYSGKNVDTIISDWLSQLEAVKGTWPSLWDYEMDLSEKVGPMSIRKPLSERMSDIESYYDGIKLPSTPVSYKAISAALNEWRQVAGLRMKSIDSAAIDMRMNTNSGSPYFTKRSKALPKTLPSPSAYVDGESVVQMLRGGDAKYNACAIVGWRGQEGGRRKSDVKQRVVWMFPLAVNLCEAVVTQPIINGMQRTGLIPSWVGNDAVDLAITKLFDTKSEKDPIVCTDFSKFDQHFNHELQDCGASIIRALFKGQNNLDSWLNQVYPIKYMIPLAIDYNRVIVGPHGMASGSGGTNLDETLVHRTLQHEAAIDHGRVLNPYSQCLGDDGIISYPGVSCEDVMRSYTAHGLEMNEEKQYVSTQDCTYLRRWHHKDYRINGVCVGVYSTCRALGRLAEQERYYDPEVWSKELVALRQISILENCKWHPLREQFVEYCMKGDKFRLGLDIPGFLDNIVQYAEEAIEYMPDFLGYSRSLEYTRAAHGANIASGSRGISTWWVVQYLKSKA